MRLVIGILWVGLALASASDAQTRPPAPKTPSKAAPKTVPKAAPRTPARKPAPLLPPTRQPAEWRCPSELGVGVTTGRRFCDVLTDRDPKDGLVIAIPPHVGPVTLFFELHNRHMYSAELVAARKGYRKYTATVGVLSMDNTLIERAVIQNEFRAEKDLFDRIAGGAAGGVKAVAPTGDEFIAIVLPESDDPEVAILGEKLSVVRPDGVDNFQAPGRPVASVSNIVLEYRPAPPKKAPVRRR